MTLSKTTHSLLSRESQNAGERGPVEGARTYRFGPFILDTARRLLLRGAERKPLPEKLFQVLLLLLEADGRPIDKETFFERLWPGEFVTDANLTQQIFLLRGILGESARDHEYVVTLPGQGYRFATPPEVKRGLAMKGSCERCSAGLANEAEAFICSYECTFCPQCAREYDGRCPNCGGELVFRPRRR